MTKWFDTNYHYLVPELDVDQQFRLRCRTADRHGARGRRARLHAEAGAYRTDSHSCGCRNCRAWLPKSSRRRSWPCCPPCCRFTAICWGKLEARAVGWVQIDEPVLVLDLPPEWIAAFDKAYAAYCRSRT